MANICTSLIVALMIGSIPWTRDAVAAEPKSADYAALSEAILEGKEPRMPIDLSACQVHGVDIAGPPIKASIRFDGYMIQADGTIAFSTTHMTVRSDRSVREFPSFRVHANGKIEVRTVTLGVVNFAVLKDTSFDCEIGRAATFRW
ncbi:VirK family protein [Bradyrhizobium sp. LB11.1]|uniref:VirK family protein n=1 Tax=Bradyrhizobium sp. LB11.1 TaxID=3156326 RepID=UPI00339B3B7D